MNLGLWGCVMRTLLRPGIKGVLVKVEERGLTSFVIGGAVDEELIYLDFSEALSSFAELEGGASRPRSLGERRRPLLGRLRRTFQAVPARPSAKR
jgi:hypothetical protein